MNILAILGASGHGRVVADVALESGWDGIVFFDDAADGQRTCGGWPIEGGTADLAASGHRFAAAIVAIGNNVVRLQKLVDLDAAGVRLATLVHPRAVVSRSATLGIGSVVCAGAVVNPSAVVGRAAIVNTCASVDHDCVLGDGVHISPGAHIGGHVRIGDRTWVGIGAAIRHQVTVGQDVIIGAGAAVIRDVPSGLTVVGVPAESRTC